MHPTTMSSIVHQRMWAVAMLLVVVLCRSTSACTSDRPGWATHRTLYVPFGLMGRSAQDQQWRDELCCVYTHVVEIQSTQASMRIYDGSSYTMPGARSFADLARRAMSDICAMSMGRVDCQQQSQCRNQARRGTPSAITTQASRMCPLRDVCSWATTVGACRSSNSCCYWSMFGQCQARQTFQCNPWQQVSCRGF